MRPRSQADGEQFRLFQAHFDQILNPDHPLVALAQKIDWQRFDAAFADCYCPDNGAPGKAIRLLVGLHYLKHALRIGRVATGSVAGKPVLAVLLRLYNDAA